MGLFRKKNKNESHDRLPASLRESLQEYSGMRVEVLDEEGELLFVAKLVISAAGIIELQQISELAGIRQEDSPAQEQEEEETLRISLRGYDSIQEQAVHLEGDMLRESGNIWRVANLKILRKGNDRAYFRQKLEAVGTVRPLDVPGAGESECSVINLSLGGICFQSAAEFAEDGHVLIRTFLKGGGELSPHCVICRVTPLRAGKIEYGCKFVQLSRAEEDMISKVIMQLQVRRLHH